VAEIEVCGSFDLGDDELLDRIEADGAEPDRVERGCGDKRLERPLSAWMNSRLPRLPTRAINAVSGGRRQFRQKTNEPRDRWARSFQHGNKSSSRPADCHP